MTAARANEDLSSETRPGDPMPTDPARRRARTRAILAEIAETDPSRVNDGDRLREDLGLDSLQSLELLSVVSEELRIDLPMEEAVELRTVADACRFVEDAWQTRHGRAPRA